MEGNDEGIDKWKVWFLRKQLWIEESNSEQNTEWDQILDEFGDIFHILLALVDYLASVLNCSINNNIYNKFVFIEIFISTIQFFLKGI
jgi:hypothetical protein